MRDSMTHTEIKEMLDDEGYDRPTAAQIQDIHDTLLFDSTSTEYDYGFTIHTENGSYFDMSSSGGTVRYVELEMVIMERNSHYKHYFKLTDTLLTLSWRMSTVNPGWWFNKMKLGRKSSEHTEELAHALRVARAIEAEAGTMMSRMYNWAADHPMQLKSLAPEVVVDALLKLNAVHVVRDERMSEYVDIDSIKPEGYVRYICSDKMGNAIYHVWGQTIEEARHNIEKLFKADMQKNKDNLHGRKKRKEYEYWLSKGETLHIPMYPAWKGNGPAPRAVSAAELVSEAKLSL